MRLFKKTSIDFLGATKTCLMVSAALIVAGTVSLVAKKGPNFGVDFTGGAQIVYGFSAAPNEDQVRKIVEGAGVPLTSVQRYDRPEKNQILLRVPMATQEGRDVSKEATAALTQALFPQGTAPGAFDLNLNGAEPLTAKLVQDDPEKVAARPAGDPKVEYARIAEAVVAARSEAGLFKSVDEAVAASGVSPAVGAWLKEKTVTGPFTLLSAENVGPQVGKDLRQRGIWAIVLSWAAMLAYIAVRFRSASFGTAAVLALVHDTWITLGLCSFLNVEISLTVVAAFLTLIGYSVNDTVVVYDRIRENREKSRKEPLDSLVNRSINETLSRTVITSGLTFLVVLALFLLGGEVLRGFSFVLLFGIIVGTYSSIFVAAPLVVAWEGWKAKRAAAKAPAPAAAKPNGKAARAK
ncbi:MAG: protein translocase subunit SecF [Acidobacteria bacterium]|nr:MAG: protein translocase subunit SecF [Acidobacteriota bacterium]MCE7959273.1 protein translocase subunit SecF [Acidobacteria bacterium ACB2]